MPILVTDLKHYLCASRPEDDASLTGGAIDANCVMLAAQLAANDVVRVVSDNAGDNQNVTITGRLATSEIDTDVIVLNGLTPVSGAKTFERILKVDISAAPAGNITVERNTGPNDDIVIIPAGKTAAAIQFISSTSEASITTRFEKAGFKNEHATDTLTSAEVTLTSDPSASVRIAVETAKNDSTTVANRKATPAGVSFVDDGVVVAVPGNQLEAAAAVNYWAELTRAADAAAIKTSYTVQLGGVTA